MIKTIIRASAISLCGALFVTDGALAAEKGHPAAKASAQLRIGASSAGAGAGKVSFNPFQITRKTDRASPTLF